MKRKGRRWWTFRDSDTGSSDYESAALTAMLKVHNPAFCLGLRLLKPERAGGKAPPFGLSVSGFMDHCVSAGALARRFP